MSPGRGPASGDPDEGRPAPDVEGAELLRLLSVEQLTYAEIAQRWGIAVRTVARLADRHQLAVPRGRRAYTVPPDLAAEVIRLYTVDRLGQHAIAERLRLSRVAVARLLDDAGVERHRRGRPARR